jgi:hypothetical protein
MTTWNEDREYVKNALEDLKAGQSAHGDRLTRICVAIASLKVKAGIWGLLAGLIPVTIALAVWAITQ